VDPDVDPDEDREMELEQEEEPDWADLLMPGETRLSYLGLADGLDPADTNDDYVVWCHGQTGRLFSYRLSTRQAKEIVVEGVEHLCYWTTVNQNKVFSVAYSGEELNPFDLYEIDIETFSSLVTKGQLEEGRGERKTAESLYEQAIALYKGDFLPQDLYALNQICVTRS